MEIGESQKTASEMGEGREQSLGPNSERADTSPHLDLQVMKSILPTDLLLTTLKCGKEATCLGRTRGEEGLSAWSWGFISDELQPLCSIQPRLMGQKEEVFSKLEWLCVL